MSLGTSVCVSNVDTPRLQMRIWKIYQEKSIAEVTIEISEELSFNQELI